MWHPVHFTSHKALQWLDACRPGHTACQASLLALSQLAHVSTYISCSRAAPWCMYNAQMRSDLSLESQS